MNTLLRCAARALALLLLATSAHAAANYVYHEQTAADPGTGGQYMNPLAPTAADPVEVRFKIEFQFYTDQARVYYTTDGSAPSGAFGVPAGTTAVLTAANIGVFSGVDVNSATIPAQAGGTTVKYIVSAWHSGGGVEIFGNSGEFISPFTTSGQANVFSYTVPDTTAPQIMVAGANPQSVYLGTSYTELGAVAFDAVDGTIAATPSGTVDTNTVGSTTITYTATDAATNVGTATRTVNVVATPVWAENFLLPGGMNGTVTAIAETADAFYYGGSFTTAGGIPANNLVRVDKASGFVSALGSAAQNGTNSTVSALAVSGTDLYVGGAFGQVSSSTQNAISANFVAKWSTTGNTWAPLGSAAQNGTGTTVNALAVMGTDLYVGGGFTTVSSSTQASISAARVAKWSTTGSTWAPLGSAAQNGTSTTVRALAVSGNDLYVGGDFTTVSSSSQSGISANRVAQWSTTAGTWAPLGSATQNGTSTTVNALAMIGSDLYAGGQFTAVSSSTQNGISANTVAKWSTTGSTWAPLGSAAQNGTSTTVRALAVSGSDLYVGGQFTTVSSSTQSSISAARVAKWSTTGSTWAPLGSAGQNGVSSTVNALAVSGSDVYAGGAFTLVSSSTQPLLSALRVAKWSATAGTWSAAAAGVGYGDGIDGPVVAVLDAGSVVYVGGVFTRAGSVAANNIACWTKATRTWSALGSATQNGPSGTVRALAMMGSDLYVGGSFTTVSSSTQNAISANFIAKWSTTGSTWAPLGSAALNGTNGQVNALAVLGGDLYVGGGFGTVTSDPQDAITANRVAKWSPTGSLWTPLGSAGQNGVNNTVNALAVLGTDLYVGGGFIMMSSSTQNSIDVNRVAKWSTTSSTWAPLGGSGPAQNGTGATVRALAVIGTDLHVGGDFTTVSSSTQTNAAANRIGKWSTTDSTWAPLGTAAQNGAAGGAINVLAVSGTDLYAGGAFTTVSSSTQQTVSANRVAKWSTTGSVWTPLGSATQNGVSSSVNALAVIGTDLYVAGNLNTVSSTTQLGVASPNFGIYAPATPPATAPTVTTPTSTSVTTSTATLGGDVTSDGGEAITERGVVYSITTVNNDPTLATGTVVTTSGTTGIFTANVSSLSAGTGYTFKAYATNAQGTSYTSAATFTTLSTTVTNTADSGAGSLRQALADAALLAGADTITLDASLSGQTITFTSEITVSDADGVTIDASALAGGVTLSGGGTSRIFTVAAGGNLTLINLTLANGNGDQGGALLNLGTVVLTGCTLSGNSAVSGFGGAIRNQGAATMTRCTLSGNSSPNEGGAYFGTSTGTATITHCTISANNAGTRGGGIRLAGGSANVNFTIVAGNTRAGSLTHPEANLAGTALTGGTNLISTAPLLAALASNGGPTQTMAVLAGSAAIDAAVGSAATEDQRGEFLYGVADIGAYEYKGGVYVVTNNADSGAGSLRQTLADAAAASGADAIEFDAALSGGTITFGSEIVVSDTAGVTVDASALAAGLTLSGGGTNRIFSVASGTSFALVELTLTGGNGIGAASNGNGGAIYNAGTATLTRCTLSGNTAGTTPGGPETGGAMFNASGGTLVLTQCTVAGNACISNRGGALTNNGTATFTHCTVSANTANFDSGAIRNEAALTLENTIIFGNTVTGGPSGDFNGGASVLTLLGANLIATPTSDGVITGSGTSNPANPLLGALASNGGPTQTMALLAGSPAIDAAVGSAITSDQRGQALVGTADVGAYENPQLAQTITFTNPGAHTFGDAPFGLVATGGGSGNAVTFAIVSGPATVSGSTLTITGAGDVTVRASQAAGGDYVAAADVDQTFTVAKAAQTISFTNPGAHTFGDVPFGLVATGGGSGNVVTFAIVSGPATVSGSTLTITGAGDVTVRASQAGDANYFAAPDADQTFTVAKAAQTISFTNPGARTFGDAPFALVASGGGSGNAVTFAIVSGPATVSGSTLTITGAGDVTVRASQAGDANYFAAPDADQTFTVAKAAQTITFTNPGTRVNGEAPFALSATGGASGNGVTFAIVSGPATVSGSTLTITGAGDLTVRASQLGNADYFDAADVDETFTVRAATTVVTTSANSGAGSLREALADAALVPGAIAITFHASLSGGTIAFASEIVVADADGVTVDASALAGGVTLSGGGTSRLFSVAGSTSFTLRGLTLTGGNGAGAASSGAGGAIFSFGALSLERCTLAGNTGTAGGAIYQGGGSLALTQCTLSGNGATGGGGAVFQDLVVGAQYTHCTIAGNTADYGGGLYVFQRGTTLENCILAGNTATTSGADLLNDAAGITSAGANIIQSRTDVNGGGYNNPGTISNADPLLGALASNGGPTQTMALGAGSPAIDAAVGSAVTSDQRGESLYYTADLGAYEYKGGTFIVTNNADSGAGSLRQVLADAAAASGVDAIEFHPSLSGQTITFASEIVVDDADAVTVDASALAGGITLDGGAGTHRLIKLNPSRSLTLIGLALANGHGGTSDAGRGGAINSNGTLTLTRCTFTSNSAAAGGAIRNSGGTLSATDCTFAGNSSPNQGGAIHSPGALTLTRCTFTGNSADEGGALYSNNPVVSQCTFSGNTGRSGAAIIFFGTLGVTHSTVWGNIVSPAGGAAISNRNAGGTLTLTNSIVEDITNFGTFTRVGANIVATLTNAGGTGTDSGPAAITSDPLLGALASNGGLTQTRAVLAGSPAIDAAVGSAATADQRGQLLVGVADIGAYEHTQTAQTITFTNPGARTFGDAPFALSATATSGLTVSFAIVSGPATVLGDTLTITGAGDVTVRASQAGDGTYNAAPDADQTFTAAKATQTIVFTNPGARTFGDAPFVLSATGGGSGNAVTFAIVSGPATVLGSTLTITGAGDVTVRASQAGDANYFAAPDVDQTFSVAAAGQAITFNLAATASVSDTVLLSATGGPSGNAVTFSVFSGPGSITGNSLTFTAAGSVVVRASQAGNTNYSAAANVDRTIAAISPLTAVDDIAVTRNTSILIDVLANDTDTLGRPRTITAVTQPVGASVVIEAGKVRFSPGGTLASAKTFTYTVTAGSDTAIGTVTVEPTSVYAGTYIGLMSTGGVVRGRLRIVLLGTGALTGTLMREGPTLAFSGSVVGTGVSIRTGVRTPRIGLTLVPGEDDVLGQPTLEASVPGSLGNTLTGTLERTPYDSTHATPAAGRYTMVANLASGGTGPATGAVLTCNITSAGMATFTGRKGRGGTISASGNLLNGGRHPFYFVYAPSTGAERLAGEMTFVRTASPAVTGTVRWRVIAGVDGRLPAGLDQNYDMLGMPYVAGANGAAMYSPSATAATLTLTMPALPPSPVSLNVPLTGTPLRGIQRVYHGSTPGRIDLYPASGFFIGDYRPAKQVNRPFFGVIIQGLGYNYGQGCTLDIGSIRAASLTP